LLCEVRNELTIITDVRITCDSRRLQITTNKYIYIYTHTYNYNTDYYNTHNNFN